MSRTIEVVIYQEDDQWVAQALNVEVSSFGATPEEARAAIQEALELYFEDVPKSDRKAQRHAERGERAQPVLR